MDVMVFNAGQREQEVRDLRREISDMVRHIQRLNGDLEALLRKVGITHINTPRVQFRPIAHVFVHPSIQPLIFNLPVFLLGRVPAEGNP